MEVAPLALLICGAVGGIVGAIAMNAFMVAVSRNRDTPIDLTSTLGTLLAGTRDAGTRRGWSLHLVMGTIFGMGYALVFALLDVWSLAGVFFWGFPLSAIHGVLASFLLVFVVWSSHPIEEYRQGSLQVGIIYLIAHLVYGVVVSLLIGIVAAVIGIEGSGLN